MSTKNVLACDVCYEDYDESDRKLLVLQCTHYFCKQCLLRLQSSDNKQCPKCRDSWAGTTVEKLVVCHDFVLDLGTTIKEAAAGCSAAGSCKHPDYAVQFWCQDCKVLRCKICLKEHIDCNWSFVFEVLEDVIKEHKKQIILAKCGINNRITEAISETEGKLANIRAEIEGLRSQEGKLVKYNATLSDLLKTTLNELNKLENASLKNQDIARLQEVMDTVKNLGASPLPEQSQLDDLQLTTSTGQPSPTPSSSLQPATAQPSSPSTDQASNLTPDHNLDPDPLCATFLSASEQQRNEVRVSWPGYSQYDLTNHFRGIIQTQ